MPNKAKKNVLQERRQAGLSPSVRTLEGVKGHPPAETSPAAARRLMAELDRLKRELTVTQQRVVELENKAHEDVLLPILNRRGFDKELERTLAYVKRHGTNVSLIYIDLNDFKDVNDIHGHAAGDAALMHLTDILIANIRLSDVVARLGGDEFAILLHHADRDAACMKADQLARALDSSALVYGGKEIPISLIAGTTQLRGDDTCAGVLARADKLMYEGKARRNSARAQGQKHRA